MKKYPMYPGQKPEDQEPDYPIARNMIKIGKPEAKMLDENGNVFNLLGIARRALHRYPAAYQEMQQWVQDSDSYEKALVIMSEYITIV